MINYNFVKLNKDDSLKIAKIMSKTFKSANLSTIEEKEEEKYIRNLMDMDAKFYGIKQGNELVSAAYYLPLDQGVSELARIMVLPNYQKQKLGSILINKSIRELKEDHVKIVFLECQKDKIDFYNQNGFDIITPQHKLYEDPSFIRKQTSLKKYQTENEKDTSTIMGRRI